MRKIDWSVVIFGLILLAFLLSGFPYLIPFGIGLLYIAALVFGFYITVRGLVALLSKS